MPQTIYALIMAGGTGSRLWPRSRTQHPKQFLDLTGDATMLQQAQARLVPLIQPETTMVATNDHYVDIVLKQVPELPPQNVLGEPKGRGTAPAIGLAAVHIRKRNPGAVMAVLTADHLIAKQDEFRRALQAAADIAGEGWLVTLGITPNYPETGYGYIERGDFLGMVGEFEGYRVSGFVEKPDLARAQEYLDDGNYAWNSGMFIWRVDRILDEMSQHMPKLYAGLMEIEAAIGTAHEREVLEKVFPTLPSETIDYGIMEKAEQVAVLPVDIGWDDVGSWSAVYDVLPKDKYGNVVVGSHLSPDSKNTLIYSPNKLVATIGMQNMIIVDTDDVLLICPRERSQDVKKLVDILKNNGGADAHYLHGSKSPEPLAPEAIKKVKSEADSLESVLLSMVLHAGLWPSYISGLTDKDVNLIHGWVTTPGGKRPLPDVTREYLFAWLREQDTLTFDFNTMWGDRDAVKKAMEDLGARAGVELTVDNLYETLARALFAASEEGDAIRKVLGTDAALVRVPLQALFPFSLEDFSGNENNELGERARNALNRAAESL
jgi:mannose-1-phosphate guanylyltransferase